MKKIHIIGGTVIGLCVVLSIYLGYLFLLVPIDEKIAAGEKRLGDLKAQLKVAETKKAQYEKFKAEAENVLRDLTFVKRRIDSSFTRNDVYRIFNNLFAANGMEDYSLSAETPRRLRDMEEFPVSVRFKGDYHQIGELLNNVVRQRRIIVPKTLKLMTLYSTREGFPTVFATVGFSVFAASSGKPGKKKGH